MKAKQKHTPASAKTWIQNVPEQKMKLTSEHTLSALKTETILPFHMTTSPLMEMYSRNSWEAKSNSILPPQPQTFLMKSQ